MLLYIDVFTGDEVGSDAFPVEEIGGGVALEFTASKITVDGGAGFAAGDDDDLDDAAKEVFNIIHANNLKETFFSDKKEFKTIMKDYVKRLKVWMDENKPDEVADWMKAVGPYMKSVFKSFDEYTFYTGESQDPEGMLILCKWSADGMSCNFIYMKAGLRSQRM